MAQNYWRQQRYLRNGIPVTSVGAKIRQLSKRLRWLSKSSRAKFGKISSKAMQKAAVFVLRAAVTCLLFGAGTSAAAWNVSAQERALLLQRGVLLEAL